jgi:hypothetical protein
MEIVDPYDEGTICQYLSGAKNVVHTLYPEHLVWKNHSSELSSVNKDAWFTAINCGIQSEVATRKMNEEIEGEVDEKKRELAIVEKNRVVSVVDDLYDRLAELRAVYNLWQSNTRPASDKQPEPTLTLTVGGK